MPNHQKVSLRYVSLLNVNIVVVCAFNGIKYISLFAVNIVFYVNTVNCVKLSCTDHFHR